MSDIKRVMKEVLGIMSIKPFENRIYLAAPCMHGEELEFVKQAFYSNWMSTVGENINELERSVAEKVGSKYAVALSCGTASLHLCLKLAGVKKGDTVFASSTTFSATVNPVIYEGGTPVFIDSERSTWNLDPEALEKAFEAYPDTKIVIVANLYGTPSKVDEILEVCNRHGAILIEDAAESFGATYKGKQTGSFGTYNTISFNGNKIITGSSGGVLLTDDENAARLARKWSTQSREPAPWYQHKELGYNYRMSNVIAGVVRGQLSYLDEHIARKQEIYERYKESFKGYPVSMNPYEEAKSKPNFWLSCILIDSDAMCEQKRTDMVAEYVTEHGKSCPTEILETLDKYNVEGRPIWKPLQLQPCFKDNPFFTRYGDGRTDTRLSVGEDIFNRGLCLPSDIKMTAEQQNTVIEIVKKCFE